MQLFFTILFLLTIFLFFRKISWGIFLYILICFLVPTLSVSYLGPNFKWAFFNIFLLVSLYLCAKKNGASIYIQPIKPFIYLFFFYLCVIPFQFSTPYSFQLSSWIGQFLRYFILPMAVSTLFYLKINKKCDFNIKILDYAIYMAIALACIYGILLIFLDGFNPYLFYMLQDKDDVERLLGNYTQAEGRLFGRIFSVFHHPMTFGVFLISSFSFSLHKLLINEDKKIVLILLLLILVNAVTCGVRSVIGGVLVAISFFIILNKKAKYLWLVILGGLVGVIIISMDETLWNYVLSIFSSDSKSDIQGSSINQRIRQFLGCLDEISSNPLFGKGYSWNSYYETVKGFHPVILAFESLIFIVICNWGILGIIAWGFFLLKIHSKNMKQHSKGFDKFYMLEVYSISYLSYVCITGDYAYTIYWMLFYVYIYMDQIYHFKKINNFSGNINK